MDSRLSEPGTQELLEDLLTLSTRQVRLLEEIRDLLAAQQPPPRAHRSTQRSPE